MDFSAGSETSFIVQNGAFASKCSASNTTTNEEYNEDVEEPCDAQVETLLSIPFLAYGALIFSPIAGYIADAYGPMVMTAIMGGCAATGIVVLMLANVTGVDGLYFLAFFLLALVVSSNYF